MVRPERAAARKPKTTSNEDDQSDWELSNASDRDDDDEEEEDEEDEEFEANESDEANNDDNAVRVHRETLNLDESPENPDGATDEAHKKAVKPRKKKEKRAEQYDTDTSDEGHLLPTMLRKTKKGGYAHTKRSRARISKANTGNTPWNKGRQRSEADKAKIAAAVRARNQAILRDKLKMFNMTEAEFRAKQKEIKYLRERVRRAKVNAKKKAEQLDASTLNLQVKLEEAIAVRDQVVNTKTKPFDKKAAKTEEKRTIAKSKGEDDKEALGKHEQVQPEKQPSAEVRTEFVQNAGDSKTENTVDEIELEGMPPNVDEDADEDIAATGINRSSASNSPTKKMIAKPAPPSRLPIVAWSMKWTPHEFDNAPPTCPNGGPTGLICCESCSIAYSRFMSQTLQEMESRRMEMVSGQVEELLGYIEETRMQLLVTSQAARSTAPPPVPVRETVKRTKTSKAAQSDMLQAESSMMEWCVTSTLDMSNWGPSTARI